MFGVCVAICTFSPEMMGLGQELNPSPIISPVDGRMARQHPVAINSRRFGFVGLRTTRQKDQAIASIDPFTRPLMLCC
jgi:hypothetical protein